MHFGEQCLKNIARPVRVCRLDLAHNRVPLPIIVATCACMYWQGPTLGFDAAADGALRDVLAASTSAAIHAPEPIGWPVKCDWRAFYPLSTLGNNTTFRFIIHQDR